MLDNPRLTTIATCIAGKAKEVLRDKLHAVVLYGSYARGDYDAESDVDIMVLADIPRECLAAYKNDFIALSSALGLEYDVVITITLKDTETFYRYLEAVPFYKTVQREGIRIAV